MPRCLVILLVLWAVMLAQPDSATAQTIVHLDGTSATLECYLAEGSLAAAVVCPGGSYCWLDYEHEGVEVARWLQSHGISAYVLRYRVAGWAAWAFHYRRLFDHKRPDDPLTDANKAAAYLWDSVGLRDIGIIGFSAGGHLALMAAQCNQHYLWAAPIYPVVSMEAPCTHRRSRRALLGERRYRKPEWRHAYSLEQLTYSTATPVFLVACKDDPVVDYHNSVLLDSALTAQHIPHRFLLYNTGGHGFAVRTDKGTPECHAWKEEFLKWFRSLPHKQ